MVISWILFLGILGLILFLSFQDGEDAKSLGADVIRKAAHRYFHTDSLSPRDLQEFTYKVRQLGRCLMFIVMGILGTNVVHVTLHKINWCVRTIIAAVILIAIAIFTERFKVYLPTRHFSEEEMMVSIYGSMLGFGVVSLISGIYSFIHLISKSCNKNKNKSKRKRRRR